MPKDIVAKVNGALSEFLAAKETRRCDNTVTWSPRRDSE
jgi:hypothetical protein